MIGITMGDPAGVGPEIVLRALAALPPEERRKCRVFGNRATLEAAEAIVATGLAPGKDFPLAEMPVDGAPLPFGRIDARAGDAAFRFVEAAFRAAKAGEIGCIVTAPISKDALNRAGHRYDGHTGMLASLSGRDAVYMMLASERLKVIHTSTHVSLRTAIELANPERVRDTIRAGRDHLRRIGIREPRVAVAGLNPHCGENGLFGDEDDRLIAPGIAMARAEGIDASGPVSADTLFYRAYRGAFDLVVANYHDQGHAPVKLVAFDTAVNVTIGLPVDRTSVDHGTAFDIAGRGVARHRNMLEAIAYGRKLAAGNGA